MSTMEVLAPYFGMILTQLAYGGSNILVKLALERGLNYIVLIVYRHLIAMAILGPIAYVLERKQRPSLTFSILMRIFVLAFFGTTIHQNVYYAGLEYTSATVASALSSVIPALTFVLAVLLRMEKVNIRNAKGRAKVTGALVCIGGAILFTLWKGYLLKGFVKWPLIVVQSQSTRDGPTHYQDDWIKGSVLILVSYVAFSAWLILQAMVYEVYPARLSTNAFICFFASLQSSAIALIFERNKSLWKLHWNIQLVAIVYSGTVISCLAYYLQTFCVSKRGPVFVAMFSPLLLVIVGLFSVFFFAERLHLGSLIGAVVIILGLYTVLWGKSKDLAEGNKDECAAQMMLQKPSSQLSSSNTECHPV